MTALTRFPSRIRFVNPDGTLTPEAARMLDVLVSRVGGGLGDQGMDMFAAPSTGGDGAGTAPDVIGVDSPAGHMVMLIAGVDSPTGPMVPMELQPASAAGFTEMTFQESSE